jgi:hypothetical protein
VGDYRKCPDCAETVLAEARVCRYCGYRFDAGARTGTLAPMRGRAPDARLPELLPEWGVELTAGEQVAFFGPCRMDSDHGYLLVTNERLVFFAPSRGSVLVRLAAPKQLRTLLDWPLERVSSAEVEGRWGRSRLQVRGPDRGVTLRDFDAKRSLAAVAAALRAAARQP